ncbi:hypothetical protein BK131_23605 [Paenibacillus amylolyticus]|uniref:Uncharacterized protein n=1 Tax=Paenibacillus amylolyticus TaxID=1451 RepID=A0A1R1BL27_PAEAM|nr:hypothetical protein [Paenibacillus amylolyticus]OMF10607.1 hypothetical protein BK131_23605 [Paenibacillus amylolyticus]
MSKYDTSFSVDQEDIPSECPICGKDLSPTSEYIDTDYHADGYRTVLSCDNGDCKFKKVLSYATNKDVEKSMSEEADY